MLPHTLPCTGGPHHKRPAFKCPPLAPHHKQPAFKCPPASRPVWGSCLRQKGYEARGG